MIRIKQPNTLEKINALDVIIRNDTTPVKNNAPLNEWKNPNSRFTSEYFLTLNPIAGYINEWNEANPNDQVSSECFKTIKPDTSGCTWFNEATPKDQITSKYFLTLNPDAGDCAQFNKATPNNQVEI